jgi:hypothetical protein
MPENLNTIYETAVQLNEARAQQDGNQIQIKARETLQDWFPFEINQDKGLLSKIF